MRTLFGVIWILGTVHCANAACPQAPVSQRICSIALRHYILIDGQVFEFERHDSTRIYISDGYVYNNNVSLCMICRVQIHSLLQLRSPTTVRKPTATIISP